MTKNKWYRAFGFVMMERMPGTVSNWRYTAYTASGRVLTTCNQSGMRLLCDKTGYLAP